MATSFNHYNDVTDRRAANMRFFYLSLGLVPVFEIIRIYHEYEGRIKKSILRIIVFNHEACRVKPNGDSKGWNFLSYPYAKNGIILLAHQFSFILKYASRSP